MLTCYTFGAVPAFAQGLVRDLRVRWAMEEAGLPYGVRLVGEDIEREDYRRTHQPFGQVPAIEEDGFQLFESGAIVLYIAEKSEKLAPRTPEARAKVQQWAFVALNSVEPHLGELVDIDIFSAEEDWAKQRRPAAVKRTEARLDLLAAKLDGRDYATGAEFSVADILLATALKELRHTDLIDRRPVLMAYMERCFARPAYRKALADHMAVFERQPEPA